MVLMHNQALSPSLRPFGPKACRALITIGGRNLYYRQVAGSEQAWFPAALSREPQRALFQPAGRLVMQKRQYTE